MESKLNLAVGLLKTLNARFATFSFTDTMLYLHVLSFRTEDVFSYVYERDSQRMPAEDLWDMINELGGIWHTQRRRTGKRHVATRHVMERAKRNEVSPEAIKPLDERRPAVRRRSLRCFKMRPSDLTVPDATQSLKSAYRREVKIHHPDRGGDAAVFRRIHEAHKELAEWIRNPRYKTLRGVPHGWSYDSERERKWLPPAVVPPSRV